MNRFSLRTYFPATVDSTMVAGQWKYDTVYHTVPDFKLTSHTGTTFSQKNLEGKIYVANFFYTACQAPCTQMSTQLGRVQDAFRLQPDVKIVSYTTKPQEDTPEVLRAYAQSFHAKPEKWVFLTGPSDQIDQLASQGYRLTFPESALPEQTPQAQSNRLVLVDKEKQVRGIYDGTDAAEVDRLITEINVLLAEYNLDHGK
ncbi:SCO family protein [Rufibacter glacialis]|uniref:SCO family protein n=1 Tax=Rufibacter glacialis TaxID=1259555 RepID=A0ABV4RCI2_9BACT|nr:SCO family protein [Rufibacter glacialis]